jgi:hypothetical protein
VTELIRPKQDYWDYCFLMRNFLIHPLISPSYLKGPLTIINLITSRGNPALQDRGSMGFLYQLSTHEEKGKTKPTGNKL